MVLANEANEAEAPDTVEEGRRERKKRRDVISLLLILPYILTYNYISLHLSDAVMKVGHFCM